MGKKLLVADDSLTIQKVIKLALSNDGYEIQTVSDGNEAIQAISLFRPDVVLVDIALPGKSAFDVKKTANADSELRKVPFVLMSSAFEKVDEAKVALLQFDGRLTKPFDPSHLRQVLNQAVSLKAGTEGQKPLPPPPPSPAPAPIYPPSGSSSRTAPGMQSSRTPAAPSDDITLSDPIWSDSERTNPNIQLPDSGPGGNTRLMAMHVEEKKPDPPFSLETNPDRSDTDIKHLTESTVKMSGLDDLNGWSLNETAKSNSVSGLPEMFADDRRPPPPASSPATPAPQLSPYATGFLHTPPASTSSPSGLPDAPAQELPTTAEIEEMVEKQVRAQLEDMMRRALPDITERIVKQEIKRLLDSLT